MGKSSRPNDVTVLKWGGGWEGLGEGIPEAGEGVGFGDEAVDFHSAKTKQDILFAIAAGNEDGDIGAKGPKLSEGLNAIEMGHGQIQDGPGDARGLSTEEGDGGVAIKILGQPFKGLWAFFTGFLHSVQGVCF